MARVNPKQLLEKILKHVTIADDNDEDIFPLSDSSLFTKDELEYIEMLKRIRAHEED